MLRRATFFENAWFVNEFRQMVGGNQSRRQPSEIGDLSGVTPSYLGARVDIFLTSSRRGSARANEPTLVGDAEAMSSTSGVRVEVDISAANEKTFAPSSHRARSVLAERPLTKT
jgi:hypothetical protein